MRLSIWMQVLRSIGRKIYARPLFVGGGRDDAQNGRVERDVSTPADNVCEPFRTALLFPLLRTVSVQHAIM